MTYYVYIVECKDGSLYSGFTTDLAERVRAHNGEVAGGARYTRGRRPVVLRYHEAHPTLSDARKREYVLKQLTRSQKLALITHYSSLL